MARNQKPNVVNANNQPEEPATAADALRRLIARALASQWRRQATSLNGSDEAVPNSPKQSDQDSRQ